MKLNNCYPRIQFLLVVGPLIYPSHWKMHVARLLDVRPGEIDEWISGTKVMPAQHIEPIAHRARMTSRLLSSFSDFIERIESYGIPIGPLRSASPVGVSRSSPTEK